MEEFVAGKGLQSRWQTVNRNNHYLDTQALACVGGHGIGQRVVLPDAPAPAPPHEPPAALTREEFSRRYGSTFEDSWGNQWRGRW